MGNVFDTQVAFTSSLLSGPVMAASKDAAKSAPAGSAAKAGVDGPFWTGHPSPEAFAKLSDDRLARAKGLVDKLVAASGPRTSRS